MRAYISGTGSYLPARVMTNAELCERVPNTSDAWIRERLGIETRRVAAPDEQVSDLGAHAGRAAIENASLQPNDVGGIICAVGIGDVVSPATAGYIQHKLGIANGCFAIDVKMACAGTIGGIAMARALVETGQADNVMVVGSQIATRTSLNWNDRTTAPIFGDGAGAAIVSRSPDGQRGILESRLHTDGSLTGIVGQYAPGSLHPLEPGLFDNPSRFVTMDGRAVWDCAIREMPAVVREVLAAQKMAVSDVDFVVSHQANKVLLHSVLRELGVPVTRTHTNVEKYANTTAASAMIALDEAARMALFGPGALVVLLAIGAGMSWGAHLIRW